MASSTSQTEASELRRRGRQRLIGAIVLVLLLVVFVPMLLDSEPRTPRESPPMAIPSKDAVAPLPSPPPAAPVVAPKVVAEAPVEQQKPAPVPAEVTPAPTPAAVTAAPAKAAPAPVTPAAAPARSGFAVQVGAFRDEAKLRQAEAKLKAAGVTHYTERLDGKTGPLTRLRAGPFNTREQAEAAQAKLKSAALDGKVIPLP